MSKQPPKPLRDMPPGMDVIIKYMGDVNGSLAAVQQSVEDVKALVEKKIEDLEKVYKDMDTKMSGRIAVVSNQMAYFRETVCDCMKETVSYINLGNS